MSIISDLFGKSPFGPLVAHTKKVHECVKVIRPLMEALINKDYEEIHRLQDKVSKLEYEADEIKHEVGEQLSRRFFIGMDKNELVNFLRCQDRIADGVEDFAVVLLIRNTVVHPELAEEFLSFADQVVKVSNTLMSAAEELESLAATAFGGAEADSVLSQISGLGTEEWEADKLQRKVSQHIYSLENVLDPLTIIFYEKILITLSRVANEAENTGDLLRVMIVKS